MADYLCPNSQLSVEDQKDIFQIRTEAEQILYPQIEETHSHVSVEKF